MAAARHKHSFDIGGGTVFAFAASPSGSAFYAACSNGLYRSGDGGMTWRSLKLPTSDGSALACTALAAAGERSLFAAVQGAILRSSDGGGAWFTAAFPTPPPLFSCLALSPDYERDGMMLAGTLEDGIFSSNDRGVTWQPWNFGLFDLTALCLALSPDFATDETVYAGTETGLYRSENGGRAWRFTAFPSDKAPLLSLAIMQNDCGGKRIFAGTENHGILRSDDGDKWDPLESDNSGAVNQLQAVGADTLLALTDAGVMLSRDRGASWETVWRSDALITAAWLADEGATLLLGDMGAGITCASL